MGRARRLDRRGQGLIGLLVMAVIVGYLWKSGMLAPVKINQEPAPVVKEMPDTARASSFKMAANQVKSALSQYQMNKPGVPKDLAELHAVTGIDLMKDPWGGQYYVQQGYLRCTGNPNVSEKVW